eukprot:UN22998
MMRRNIFYNHFENHAIRQAGVPPFMDFVFSCHFLVTETIFFENYHLMASKCYDTLGSVHNSRD